MHRSLPLRRWMPAVALPALAAIVGATGITVSAAADDPGTRIATSDRAVAYGERVTLRGELPDAGESVQVAFQPATSTRWRTVTAARSDAGSFAARVPVRRSGRWRAEADNGERTASTAIRVRAASRIAATRHVTVGGLLRLRGLVRPARAGLPVRIEVSDGRRIRTAATTRTRHGGRIAVRLRAPGSPGHHTIRALVGGDRSAAWTRSPRKRLITYRRAAASYYGPGLYGNPLACGGRLTPSTRGVAHRTLPCGTRVTFRYRGRMTRVSVIDRGPYHYGRTWDLTAQTKRDLGFGSTGTVLSSR